LPEFGCGARDLLFAGNNEVLRAAAEFTIARALQTHLGDEAMINAVDVVREDERLQT
ncbi:MAG: GPW/gp25 family protein, partial [Gammaproteobacteria bacterium]|nr:GPW/gp25 family protein [Gammaproteobacteria bacterium]